MVTETYEDPMDIPTIMIIIISILSRRTMQ